MLKKSLYLAVFSLLSVALINGSLLADAGPQHQVRQSRPIQLGTSGGNINDMSSGFCCSGTLGALVEDGSVQYVLSNNHVLARTNVTAPGEGIIQPGLIDQHPACAQNMADIVANLSDFAVIGFKVEKPIPLNEIDAAIAQVVSGAVEPNGAILDVGLISPETAEAVLGQAVKKSGRTTGLTTGVIQDIDVTVDVAYTKECGMGGTQIARFINQIVIGPAGFCAGGDSGSLIVEDVASNPRAIGLLFAGSSKTTVANPINAVLSAFGVTMVGVPPEPKPTGSISGTVTRSTDGSPIEGAIVAVDTGESVATGADGMYLITGVVIGNHSINASFDDFKAQTKTATVDEGNTIVDFSLKPHKGRGKALGHAAIDHAKQVKKRHEQTIFQISGVVGTGVGLSETGQPVIDIYFKDDLAKSRAQIPAVLDDVPVRATVTGQFEAF
jgi:hypothetical protein